MPMPKSTSRLTKPIAFSRGDVRAAMGDWLALRAGLVRAEEADPIAQELLDPLAPANLADVACHLSGRGSGVTAHEAAREFHSTDFSDALAVGLSQVAGVSYARQAAEHSVIVKDLTVPDLRPVAFPVIDVGELTETPNAGGPIEFASTFANDGVFGAANVFSARFLIPRRLLVNDDAGVVTLAVAQLSGHAARLEAQAIAAILASNPNLGDSAALIDTGNTASGGIANATGLAAAAGLMRTRVTSGGNVANVRARFWLVAGDAEFAALTTLGGIYSGGPLRIEVATNAWLPAATASYLLASPDDAPTFVRLGLTSPPKPSVIQRRAPPGFDGLAYVIEHVFGIAAVSRDGLVKVTA